MRGRASLVRNDILGYRPVSPLEGIRLRYAVYQAFRTRTQAYAVTRDRARLDRRPFEYDYEHHFIEHEPRLP
jgi:hypothetical protein